MKLREVVIGQQAVVRQNELGTVTAVSDKMPNIFVEVYVPSRGYASRFDPQNVRIIPLPDSVPVEL